MLNFVREDHTWVYQVDSTPTLLVIRQRGTAWSAEVRSREGTSELFHISADAACVPRWIYDAVSALPASPLANDELPDLTA